MQIDGILRKLLQERHSVFDSWETTPDIFHRTDELGRLPDDTVRALNAGAEGLLAPLSILPRFQNFLSENSCGFAICARENPYDKAVAPSIFAALAIRGDRLLSFTAETEWITHTDPWREAVTALPEELAFAFHRAYNGMHYSSDLNFLASSFHQNLPKALLSLDWSNVENFRAAKHLRKIVSKKIANSLGDPYNIHIWLQSDWGDMLLVNQNAMDKKVYHVKDRKFDDYFELKNPVEVMDRYCLHVVSGQTEAFNFRQ